MLYVVSPNVIYVTLFAFLLAIFRSHLRFRYLSARCQSLLPRLCTMSPKSTEYLLDSRA